MIDNYFATCLCFCVAEMRSFRLSCWEKNGFIHEHVASLDITFCSMTLFCNYHHLQTTLKTPVQSTSMYSLQSPALKLKVSEDEMKVLQVHGWWWFVPTGVWTNNWMLEKSVAVNSQEQPGRDRCDFRREALEVLLWTIWGRLHRQRQLLSHKPCFVGALDVRPNFVIGES